MQAVNANFAAAAARDAQSPTYYAAIDGIASAYATHVTTEANLVPDGGFEEVGLPDWTHVTTGGTCTRATLAKHSGLASVKLTRTDGGSGAVATFQNNIELSVVPFLFGVHGEQDYLRYRISFWAKTDSGVGPIPTVICSNVTQFPNYVHPNGRVIASVTNTFSDARDLTADWQYYSKVFTILRDPSGTPFPDSDVWQVNLRHGEFSDNSSIWYDDVRICLADPRSPTKKIQLMPPSSSGVSIDPIDGVRTTQTITMTLIDAVRGDSFGNFVEDVTSLIATEAPGAEVSTLINRKVTLFAGYRDLLIEDYEPIFVGRIRSLKMATNLTSYIMTVSDVSYLLDGEIYSNATDALPSQIVGNVVNVYASILRGVFSVSDPDFPLESVTASINVGTHDGNAASQTLDDSGGGWSTNEWAGFKVRNTTTGVEYHALTNTATKINFSNPTSVVWNIGDAYQLDTGKHDGSADSTFLEDSSQAWVPDEFIGMKIRNTTKDAEGVVTANNATQIFATMTGGSTNDWDVGNVYFVGMSAPTGLNIPDALLDIAGMKAERDRWHLDDDVAAKLIEPENGREYLRDEFFRAFQSWPTVTGDGLLGCRFHVPALPPATAPTIVQEEILSVVSWTRDFASHLNRFTVRGDYDPHNDDFSLIYAGVLSEDTADQAASGETIEYLLESKWIQTRLNGLEIAEELANRLRIRYIQTPAVVVVEVPNTKRLIEEGDVVAVTHKQIPNLFTGTRGLVAKMMTVQSRVPNFEQGSFRLTLLDANFRRYGVIAPDSQVDFGSATDAEKGTFFFISDTNALMGDGSEGYRFA